MVILGIRGAWRENQDSGEQWLGLHRMGSVVLAMWIMVVQRPDGDPGD